MPDYTRDELVKLSFSELCQPPEFLYKELDEFIPQPESESEEEPEPKAAPQISTEEEDDTDTNLSELASRYFLQRSTATKKTSHPGGVPVKYAKSLAAQTADTGSSQKSNSRHVAAPVLGVSAVEEDEDEGWSVVAPKHAHHTIHHGGYQQRHNNNWGHSNRRSFGTDSAGERRKFQGAQGARPARRGSQSQQAPADVKNDAQPEDDEATAE